MSGRWQRRSLPVCASTELELDRWLKQQPPPAAATPDSLEWRRLVVAKRQRFGHGQQGRIWTSPAGGLWLSAAFPWPAHPERAAALPLALSLGLACQLEQIGLPERRIPLAIKWPNDLIVQGRKLAGLLPRLRLRGGRVRWGQVGLGLNGTNPVPVGAIGLGEALQAAAGRPGQRFDPRATPRTLERLACRSIETALALADQPEQVRQGVEQRLWRPAAGIERDGTTWRIAGLLADGGLAVVAPDGRRSIWRRTF
ncbi:MAG: biotin--[acetyl-CoA-carboxylase] ligase [Cyanobacteriota bacterium]|nr:biotin--[acetyl-CoA-carboxylase] ligase [Cyanobacteriota bacterium]